MKSAAINFFRGTAGQILLFIAAFAIGRWLWTYAFYGGFTGGYEQLSARLGLELNENILIPFHSWSIFFGSLLNPVYALVLTIALIPLFIGRKYYSDRNISFSGMERLFFSAISFVIGWELATYDYNYYLDRSFYFDRILLFLLPFLIYRFPQLIIVFVAFALAYRSQFNYPVDGFPMFDKRLLFDLLMCAIVYQYCRIFMKNFNVPVMYFLLCIIASAYFASGLKKITISPHGYEWVMNNDPVHLFNNVHLRGWLACAADSTIDSLRDILEKFGQIFQWFVFLIELAALLMLRNRRLTIGLLCGFFIMHLGIFIFGSMLFWKWMVVDILFVAMLWKRKNLFNGMFSDSRLKWMSIPVIAFSFFWLKPIPIGWHDTNVNQYYTYEVVGADGRIYQFDKNDMNPHHQWFQYDQFLFLTPSPGLSVSGFGYTYDYKLAVLLQDADSSTFESLAAPVYFDEIKKKRYDNFISEYFKNRNNRMGRGFFLMEIAPPHHLYSETCENSYNGQTPVKTFRVIYNVTYTENNNSHWLMKDVIDEIRIPAQE